MMAGSPCRSTIVAELGPTLASHVRAALIALNNHPTFHTSLEPILVFEQIDPKPLALSPVSPHHAHAAENRLAFFTGPFLFIFTHFYDSLVASLVGANPVVFSSGLD